MPKAPRRRRLQEPATAVLSAAVSSNWSTEEVQPLLGTALPASLEWSFNPWQQDWRRPMAGLLLISVIASLAGWAMRTPGWALVAFAMLTGMNALLFVPVRYRLDERGVSVWLLGVPSQRDWEHYRNAYFHQNLVHLTTLPTPGPLDPFRGHSLQFDPRDKQGRREVVRPFIEAKLGLVGLTSPRT